MKEKVKLMIVDDSAIIRQAIHKYLKRYNIEVVGVAEDGKVALEVFRETKPDVVTLDITMPEIDGLTVLAEMLKINKDVMRERAGLYWSQATCLSNTIVREKNLPFRSAHQIVGILVRMAYEENKKPQDITTKMLDKAAKEFNGQPLHLDSLILRNALDPAAIVASKDKIGGTAPEMIKEDITGSYAKIKPDADLINSIEAKLGEAEEKLRIAVLNIINSE